MSPVSETVRAGPGFPPTATAARELRYPLLHRGLLRGSREKQQVPQNTKLGLNPGLGSWARSPLAAAVLSLGRRSLALTWSL